MKIFKKINNLLIYYAPLLSYFNSNKKYCKNIYKNYFFLIFPIYCDIILKGGDNLFDSGSILAKNKLKILYIFYILNIPINNTDITKFVLDKDFMDYFSLQEIISGLKDDGFVLHERKDGKNFYVISEEGNKTLEMFIEKIPKMYKEIIDNSFKSFKKEVEKKKQLVGHYFQRKDKDYTAILQAFEDDITVFNLSINVPDEETAKKIMKKWKDNPDKIYSEFINILFK